MTKPDKSAGSEFENADLTRAGSEFVPDPHSKSTDSAAENRLWSDVTQALQIPKERESALEYQLALRRKSVLDNVEQVSPAPALNARWAAPVFASILVAAVIGFGIGLQETAQEAPASAMLLDLDSEELAMSMEFLDWLNTQHPESAANSSGG